MSVSGSSGNGRTDQSNKEKRQLQNLNMYIPPEWEERPSHRSETGGEDVLANLYFGRDMSADRYQGTGRRETAGASSHESRSQQEEYVPRYMRKTTGSSYTAADYKEVEQEESRERREQQRTRRRSSTKKNSKKKKRAIWRRRIVLTILTLFLILIVLVITGLVRMGLAIHNRTPEVTLNGESEMTVFLGEKFEDPGAVGVLKDESMNFFNGKKKPKVSGEVNTGQEGTYKLTYSLAYHDKKASAERNVTVIERDLKAPEIRLDGGDEVVIFTGTNWQDSFTAVDDRDGDVSDKVEVSGTVDTSTPSTYQITYKVSDAQGNLATKTRNITVKLHPEQDPNAKIIYLTFDDGPFMYTERLLDILDQYNVKATFFVTAQFPDYLDMIGEEYRRGHAIGIHSLTHEWDEVYASDSAFWADHDAMQDIVVEQTGHSTNLMRFIGGSSNTISKRYSVGIMGRLVDQVAERGYVYFDWNVTSGDGGDTTDTDVVVQNIINECSEQKVSVVLCHDIKEFTVDGIDRVITWGLQNGYTFLPLNETSYAPHHGVNN